MSTTEQGTIPARDVRAGQVVTVDGTRATVQRVRVTKRGTVILVTTQADFWLMPSQPVRVSDVQPIGF